MGLNDGGSSGITIVMLLLEFVAAAGCSPVLLLFDVSEGCDPPQAANKRLSMIVELRKNNERGLVNIGPPV
jgi:hypothetical protein